MLSGRIRKMVILLKVYLELTYKIGTIMGMSDRKAASIYHYARKITKELEKICRI